MSGKKTWSRLRAETLEKRPAPAPAAIEQRGSARGALGDALTASAGEGGPCSHCGEKPAPHVTHDYKFLCSDCLSQVSD